MTLAPTLLELVRCLPAVDVVQRGPSREQIATARERLEADGSSQELRRKWLGNPYRDQSLAAH